MHIPKKNVPADGVDGHIIESRRGVRLTTETAYHMVNSLNIANLPAAKF